MEFASPKRILGNAFGVAIVGSLVVAALTSTPPTAPRRILRHAVDLATAHPFVSAPIVVGTLGYVLFFESSGGGSDGRPPVRFGP